MSETVNVVCSPCWPCCAAAPVKITFQGPVTEDVEEEPQPSNPEQRAARQIVLIRIMGPPAAPDYLSNAAKPNNNSHGFRSAGDFRGRRIMTGKGADKKMDGLSRSGECDL
jgi:hypothetical protein